MPIEFRPKRVAVGGQTGLTLAAAEAHKAKKAAKKRRRTAVSLVFKYLFIN